jgi:hypothetical protein
MAAAAELTWSRTHRDRSRRSRLLDLSLRRSLSRLLLRDRLRRDECLSLLLPRLCRSRERLRDAPITARPTSALLGTCPLMLRV